MGDMTPEALNIRELAVRIDRALDEAAKFRSERAKLDAETAKLMAEEARFRSERAKLDAEATKLLAERIKFDRDRSLAPWTIVVAAVGATAAIFGAGAATIKLLGG